LLHYPINKIFTKIFKNIFKDYIKGVVNHFNIKSDEALIQAKTKFSEVLMEESTENILLNLIVVNY